MKISDMFARRQAVVSFEIFPPKPEYPVSTLFTTIEALRDLKPDFISVTYGAGGSSSANSFEIADKVKNGYQLETVTHFTCIGSAADAVEQSLEQIKSLNVENILALRGDLPADQSPDNLPGDFPHAKDLIRHINQHPEFCVGAAAYPEGHIECRDMKLNIAYLKQKEECGADFFITQLFFDNSTFYRFLADARKAGVTKPISVGVMPILNAQQIKRICSLCGATIPAKIHALIDKYGGSVHDFEQAGVEYACRQIDDLLQHGVDGIHLYTMNKSQQTKTIMNCVGLR